MKTLKPRVATLNTQRTQTLGAAGWRTSGMTAAQRGYDAAWRKRREQQLMAEPLCAQCGREGRLTPATVADHITPHRGDPELFKGPLQSLCKHCHDVKTQQEMAQHRGAQ